MNEIPRWRRFEAAFRSARVFDNPTQEVEAHVEFRHESGAVRRARTFWDGGREWRVRFSPDRTGPWTYRSHSSHAGLNGEEGEFVCVPYEGRNLLYKRGPVRVADNRRHFAHEDGTPFFWLADTVWNGPIKAELRDWKRFLRDRAGKGFNAIQLVTTQWVAGAGNADLRQAFAGKESIRIDPSFFQWLDARIDMINDHGMLAVPAMVWSAPSKPWVALNPGVTLPDDQIIVLARYLHARYGAHHAAWMLAADGDYRGVNAERWQRIGRAVFEDRPALATMHPMGQIWVGDEFRNEPWFNFHGYQSSHYGADAALRWIVEGPPHVKWAEEPRHPVVNLEPCYEAHLDMSEAPAEGRSPFEGHDVRRASYWSLLASPVAGITYGAHGVWGWENRPQLPMNHFATGVSPTWRDGMKLPGGAHMKTLKEVFESVAWWTLLPAQEMLAEQPGSDDARLFISAAKSESGDLALFYLPEGGTVRIRPGVIAANARASWIDPTSGARQRYEGGEFQAPADGRDWLLLLTCEDRERDAES